MPGSSYVLEHIGSMPNIPDFSKPLTKRRFSLMGYLASKSPFTDTEKDARTDKEVREEVKDIDDSTKVDDLNKKLLLSFADIYGGSEGECHENQLFYHDNPEDEPPTSISSFGKKGKAKGDFQDAKDITILSDKRLLITDLINNRIQLFDARGRLLLLYSGTDIGEPWATAFIDNDHVAVTSRKNKCVRILALDGVITNTFGENFFKCPSGIAVDNAGQFIVCDAAANTVSIHDNEGVFVRYLGNSNNPACQFSTPRYVCVSVTGDIIVSDSGNHKISIFKSSGDFKHSFGSFGKEQNQFKCPYGVCTNKQGDIFVADHYNNRITMFSRDGVFIRHLITDGHGLRHPQGITLRAGTCLYVTHGDLKACEVLLYRIENTTRGYEKSEMICHF